MGKTPENSSHNDLRLKATINEKNTEYHCYFRTLQNIKKYRFGGLTAINLNRNIIEKMGFLFGFLPCHHFNAFIRLQHDDYLKKNGSFTDYFQNILVNIVRESEGGIKTAIEVKIIFIIGSIQQKRKEN